MDANCNITNYALSLLGSSYWGMPIDKNLKEELIKDYINNLNCTNIASPPCEEIYCDNEPIIFNCSFKVLKISNNPTEGNAVQDIIFFTAGTDTIEGKPPFTYQWTYNINHFDLVGNTTSANLRLKLKPGKNLNTLMSRVQVTITDADGCISVRACYFVAGNMECNPNFMPCYSPIDLSVGRDGNSFVLNWDNTDILSNGNSLYETIFYRRKDVQGPWIHLATINNINLITYTIPDGILSSNVIYEFKIENTCASNGPVINDNGVQEFIKLDCIQDLLPIISAGQESSSISVNLTPYNLNITKIRFRLRLTSNNSLVYETIVATPPIFSAFVDDLNPSTQYYWEIDLISNLNGEDISLTGQGVSICGPLNFETQAQVCNAPINVSVNVLPD